MARLPRGFDSSKRVQSILRSHHSTSLPKTLVTALVDILAPMALAALGLYLFRTLPAVVAVPLVAPMLLLVPRFQRGLENLTHEGSHQNWFRPDREARSAIESKAERKLGWTLDPRWARKVNNFLTNLLAAVPSFSTVSSYWVAHAQHHGHFGSELDPCRGRFESIDRSRAVDFTGRMARCMKSYVLGWWMTIGLTPRTLVYGILWHVAFWIVPCSLAIGWPAGLLVWAVFWAFPFVALLPWLRYVAESGKHDYHETSEFSATISNLGWIHRWYFYPHGDGHHLLHHWDPSIPHHLLARAHGRLVKADPDHYGSDQLVRLHVFQNPDVGAPPRA